MIFLICFCRMTFLVFLFLLIGITFSNLSVYIVGELTFFLGFHIQQRNSRIFLSQEKYAQNLISKGKPKQTCVALHLKLSKDDLGEKVDESLYGNIIGSLPF